MCEKRYFFDDRQSTQFKCVCGGSVVVLEHDAQAEKIGCQSCGKTARVRPSASPDTLIECQPEKWSGTNFYLENHGPDKGWTHCGQPMVIIGRLDAHLWPVGCQVCGAMGHVGHNSTPEDWPPDGSCSG